MAREGMEVDPESVYLLVRALRDEADGRQLRLDLARKFRGAARPALVAVRAAVRTMPSMGLGHSPSLRAKVASAVKMTVRVSRKAGVSIWVDETRPMPRGFDKAPAYLNSDKPWRHPVFGNRRNWVAQRSRRPGWFTDTLEQFYPAFVHQASEALEHVARRISMKTRG